MATTKTADVKDLGTTATPGRESSADIEAHVAQVREDIAALAKAMKAYGADKTGEYKARANKAGTDIAVASQDALASLQKEFADLERQMVNQVRARPLQSLGIAAGIGFLIAMIVRR